MCAAKSAHQHIEVHMEVYECSHTSCNDRTEQKSYRKSKDHLLKQKAMQWE